MLKISKEANPNYLCKVFVIDKIRKHTGADRLQIVTVDFQDVITDMTAKEGDVYVYFPLECKINEDFLAYINGFRDKTLNDNTEKAGFFEKNCRVRAARLRGEKSMGFIVPANQVQGWKNVDPVVKDCVGTEFDTVEGYKIVEKYVVPVKNSHKNKQGKAPALNRLVEGQVHLHVDTENLRKNLHKIHPWDDISITNKTHGTSWWVGNLQVQRKLNWFEKGLLKLGVNIETKEYDHVYGSRKVVKNKYFDDPKNQNHFYDYDLWADIKDEVGEIPKGYTLYGECLGYTKDGGWIQKDYDYGCNPGENKIEVYRITHTTPDGEVTELDLEQRLAFCERLGLQHSQVFWSGTAHEYYLAHTDNVKPVDADSTEWHNEFITLLEELHLEKDCHVCKNKVPAEGIVVRKENLFSCDSYKLKSFAFLEGESKQLDSGEVNIEDQE